MTAQTSNHPREVAVATLHTLKVPGATLYYEVRGSGPTMLIIPGGPAEAGIFSEIAGLLADRYTVLEGRES
jgi:pimeloyl-ACP methyl ester carboxylesterase